MSTHKTVQYPSNFDKEFEETKKSSERRSKRIKFVLLAILLLGLLSPVVVLFGGCFPGYSSGTRAGVVTKFSKKGLFWTSWEGEMNLGGQAVDADGSAMIRTWDFSVTDDAIAADIQQALDSGWRTSLKYHQFLRKPITIETAYVIDEVKFARDHK